MMMTAETLSEQWLELFYTKTPHPRSQKWFIAKHTEIINQLKELEPEAQQSFAHLINKGIKQRGLS